MIEVYLSTDGKHTVHLSAMSVEETERLLPEATRIYCGIAKELGTKPQLWESVMNGKSHGGDALPKAASAAPICEIHKTALALQEGRRGRFWSCHRKSELGRWCTFTREA